LERARVLAVDDHGDSLDLLRELLESAGAVVTGASSVAEALAAPGPFDIIISDVGMPTQDGYELIRGVRARETGNDVPAIALTAYARAEDAVRARRAGFDEHLAKPVDAEELLAAVKRLINAS
jgi:CheY-like chemotaxis protein